MTSKLLRLVVQGFLIDEDDAGEVANVVALQPVEMYGRGHVEQAFADHLAAIDQLCKQRSEDQGGGDGHGATHETRLQGTVSPQERQQEAEPPPSAASLTPLAAPKGGR